MALARNQQRIARPQCVNAAQDGFGALPEADDWTPREGDYPPDVWAAYQGNPQDVLEVEIFQHWLE